PRQNGSGSRGVPSKDEKTALVYSQFGLEARATWIGPLGLFHTSLRRRLERANQEARSRTVLTWAKCVCLVSALSCGPIDIPAASRVGRAWHDPRQIFAENRGAPHCLDVLD